MTNICFFPSIDIIYWYDSHTFHKVKDSHHYFIFVTIITDYETLKFLRYDVIINNVQRPSLLNHEILYRLMIQQQQQQKLIEDDTLLLFGVANEERSNNNVILQK